MTERTIAEWDMIGYDGDKDKAPWQHNAAWPFINDTEQLSYEEVEADVYSAVDCDEPFDTSFPPEMTSRQKAEMLSSVLLHFLRSLQDGVITKSLWEKLEEGIVTREKGKQQLDPDDEKMWALEILSSAPNHNASFLLIVSFLQNIIHQISEASKSKTTPRSSIDLPASPKASVRRKTLSKVPQVAIRQLIRRNYAGTFANVMFRSPNTDKIKEKEKAARKERMTKVVELFLSNGEDG